MLKLFKTNKEQKFTKAFSKVLTSKLKNLKILQINELVIKTKYGATVRTHYLDSAYAAYLKDPEQLEEVLNRHADVTLAMYNDKNNIDINKIIPILLDQKQLKNLDTNNTQPYIENYNDTLSIVYILNQDDANKYISKTTLSQQHISTIALLEKAKENLQIKTANIERHGDDGNFMITAGGSYESSLILLDSIWNKTQFPVKGEIVVGIPSRELLLITGTEHIQHLENMQQSVSEIYNEAEFPVSQHLYKRDGNQFDRFDG